jgi:transcriptional regulator with XRE-family HTH domain
MKSQRLTNVLTAWAERGHTQAEFARVTGLHPGGVTRMFRGDQRPDVDTLGTILDRVAKEHAQLARDILEAYLLDDVPHGNAPDGRAWVDLVSIRVAEFEAALQEGDAADELEMALSYLTRLARTTKHGRQFVLTFYRIKHRENQ